MAFNDVNCRFSRSCHQSRKGTLLSCHMLYLATETRDDFKMEDVPKIIPVDYLISREPHSCVKTVNACRVLISSS